MRFDRKIAVITGGASGIGAASARLIVRDGGSVVIADLAGAEGPALTAELGEDRALFVACDVSAVDQVDAMIAAAKERFGQIDIVFNNAGVTGMGATSDIDPAFWRRVLEIDLFSVFYTCRAAIPHLLAAGGGAIVNNASISGLYGDYGMSAYNAAKGGVINYSRNLALDHAAAGIRVNVVCPGVIDTPMLSGVGQVPGLLDAFLAAVPMGRAGRAEEVAELVAFLASDAASFMTGAIIPIDGGAVAGTGLPNLNAFMAGIKGHYA